MGLNQCKDGYSSHKPLFDHLIIGIRIISRCFGDFGAESAQFLYVLAFLEFPQNDDMLDKAGLPPLPPTDRSQFHARCFRQISTRISAALAKATVIHITGAPSLPAPTFLSHVNLARNCPRPS